MTNTSRIEKQKGEEARLVHVSKVAKSNEVKALGKTSDKLTMAQIKLLLVPLKRPGDKVLPNKKSELLLKLIEWEAQGALTVDEEVALVEA